MFSDQLNVLVYPKHTSATTTCMLVLSSTTCQSHVYVRVGRPMDYWEIPGDVCWELYHKVVGRTVNMLANRMEGRDLALCDTEISKYSTRCLDNCPKSESDGYPFTCCLLQLVAIVLAYVQVDLSTVPGQEGTPVLSWRKEIQQLFQGFSSNHKW